MIELACGKGEASGWLKGRNPDLEITGCDISELAAADYRSIHRRPCFVADLTIPFDHSEKYDAVNRPYLDFFKDVVAADPTHGPKQGQFVADEANFVNIIRGQGTPTPPASNLGHFHIGHEEFWFIMEGKCDYQIEGVGLLTANAGDVVLAPPGRWHRASWANGQMDTRVAFNPSPLLFHNFAEDAGGKQ